MKRTRLYITVAVGASLLLACESSDGGSSTDSPTPEVDTAQVAADSAEGDVGAADTAGPGGTEADIAATTDAGPVEVDASTQDPASDAGGSATADAEATIDVIVGEGACTNDSDLAVLEDFDVAAEQMKMGMACYDMAGGPGSTSAEEIEECFKAKLQSDYGFSLDCSVCVTDQLMCLQANCMDACMSSMMGGETSSECTECIEANGCNSDFVECSGLNPDLFSPVK